MALNIEGATIGYDSNNMASTLQHIHNDCVEETKKALRTNMDQLRDAVNECWVGQSAETYKNNMDHDVEEICKGLDAAYQGLEAEFKKAEAGLAEIDQTLVDAR